MRSHQSRQHTDAAIGTARFASPTPRFLMPERPKRAGSPQPP